MNIFTKDTTDAAFSKFNRTPELNERVRGFLNERLAQYEVDCESIHITTVNNPSDKNVVFSQDLWHLGGDTLEWGHVQVHNQGVTDIFTSSHTFEDEQKFKHLSVYGVEKLLEDLLGEALSKWGDLAVAS